MYKALMFGANECFGMTIAEVMVKNNWHVYAANAFEQTSKEKLEISYD